jgi:hypothetical protein
MITDHLQNMKNFLYTFLLVTALFTACNEHNGTTPPTTQKDTTKTIVANSHADTTITVFDNLGDYANLVPLEMKDSAAKNVYEKFGLEFSGNCYECDLAKININKKSFDLINVCDEHNVYRKEGFSYTCTPKILKVTIGKSEFIFTKIDEAPVYELQINGDKFSLKGKRLARYFTPQQKMKKFKEHDCGDFQG